jgi:hypothetical protein
VNLKTKHTRHQIEDARVNAEALLFMEEEALPTISEKALAPIYRVEYLSSSISWIFHTR